jgi:hypothetical protein
MMLNLSGRQGIGIVSDFVDVALEVLAYIRPVKFRAIWALPRF